MWTNFTAASLLIIRYLLERLVFVCLHFGDNQNIFTGTHFVPAHDSLTSRVKSRYCQIIASFVGFPYLICHQCLFIGFCGNLSGLEIWWAAVFFNHIQILMKLFNQQLGYPLLDHSARYFYMLTRLPCAPIHFFVSSVEFSLHLHPNCLTKGK